MAKYHSITLLEANLKLSYDPYTGDFVNRKTGAVYMATDGHGYRVVRFGGVSVLLHRLAFLMMIGRWPSQHVDHINGVITDNRWSNLRDVPQRINCQNKRHIRSGEKLLGATLNQNRWEARITIGSKVLYLGRFKTAIEAHHAYLEAANKVLPITHQTHISVDSTSRTRLPRQESTAIAACLTDSVQ